MFEKIERLSEGYFKYSHHSRSHTERVLNLAVRIGKDEGADLDIIVASAWLHDIARALEDENKIDDHAVEGAKMARKILELVDFPNEKIDAVAQCIEAHRFSKDIEPKSIEAKILQDADRLDVIGAIGIARVFAKGGSKNIPIYDPSIQPKRKYDGKSETSVNHIYEKLLKTKERFNTTLAKKIADERHGFVEEYLSRFHKEWYGEL